MAKPETKESPLDALNLACVEQGLTERLKTVEIYGAQCQGWPATLPTGVTPEVSTS
jgi:hypothetical protein